MLLSGNPSVGAHILNADATPSLSPRRLLPCDCSFGEENLRREQKSSFVKTLSLSLSLPWSVEVFGAPTFQYEDWLSRCRQIWPRTTLQQRSLTCGVLDNFITTSLLHIFARWELSRLRPGRPASQPIPTPLIVCRRRRQRQDNGS